MSNVVVCIEVCLVSKDVEVVGNAPGVVCIAFVVVGASVNVVSAAVDVVCTSVNVVSAAVDVVCAIVDKHGMHLELFRQKLD